MALRALTDNQAKYIKSINSHIVTFGVGLAGTGKSYIPVALASEAFKANQIRKIIITRPVVQAGNSLGYLPGLLQEKLEPYMAPLVDIFNQQLGASQFAYALKAKQIVPTPLEMLRGSTFNDSWVILDEAQNVTKQQMLMFLTRIGRNCKVIITGDPAQCDLKVESGLMDAVNRLAGLPDVAVTHFFTEDIVRSGLVRDVLIRYAS